MLGTAVLLFIGLGVIGTMLPSRKTTTGGSATTTKPAASQPSAVDAAAAEKEAAAKAALIATLDQQIQKLVQSGAVTRIQRDGGDVYLNELAWAGLKIDAKENVIRLFSRYREAKTGLPQVTIHGDRSGRELASWGPFQGFKFN
jgi:hypothetical protein